MSSRKMLVPIDESDHSRKAFQFCISDVVKSNDIILLLHVFTSPSPPGIYMKTVHQETWGAWREKIDKKASSIRVMKKEYEDICIKTKIRHKFIVHNGNPGQGICDMVKEHQPCMVIMGTRGQNVVRRTIFGSVSDYVVHHTDVPVIVIPPRSDIG